MSRADLSPAHIERAAVHIVADDRFVPERAAVITDAASGIGQASALADAGVDAGLLAEGDLVGFLAAGTGYTWAATVLTWHGD